MDRLAVLIFRVGEETTDDTAERLVSEIVAPRDWTFESAAVVTTEREFKGLSWGMWE